VRTVKSVRLTMAPLIANMWFGIVADSGGGMTTL